MQRRRLLAPLSLALFLGVLAAAAISPAAAQGADSVTEQLITDLNGKMLAIAIPVTLLVEGILFYTVWKFRKTDEAKPTMENRRLEVTWTIATAVILLFVGFAAYSVLASPMVTATQDTVQQAQANGDPVVVVAQGQQFTWNFEYPEQNVTVRGGPMVIPTDRTIIIKTTSTDVIHSFHAPELGLKADALPGQYNYLQTRVTNEGTYQLYCAEYCGSGHSNMLAKIEVKSPEGYQQWLDQQQGGSSGSANSTASA